MNNNSELLFEIREMRSLLKVVDERLEYVEKEFKKSIISTSEEMISDNIWDSAKNVIKTELTEASFNTWLKPIEQFKIEEDTIYLQVSNEFTKSILEARYMNLIENAVRLASKKSYGIEFVVEKEGISKLDNEQSDDYSDKRISSFVADIGKRPQLLYLYGGIGLGKTHIVEEMKNDVLGNNKEVKYMTTYEFIDGLIESIRDGGNKEFRKSLVKNDLLIIDDFQRLAGKERSQEEFCIIANELIKMGNSVVIVSTKSPKETKIMNEKFNLMFEIDKLVEINKPDLDKKIKILKSRLLKENIDIEDEYLEIIAENCSENLKELINMLNRIINYVELTQEELNEGVINKLLQN